MTQNELIQQSEAFFSSPNKLKEKHFNLIIDMFIFLVMMHWESANFLNNKLGVTLQILIKNLKITKEEHMHIRELLLNRSDTETVKIMLKQKLNKIKKS